MQADMHALKIVYVGQLSRGSTSIMRRDALRQLGHQIVSIDSSVKAPALASLPGVAYRAMWKYGIALDTNGLRKRLLAAVCSECPDVVWIDKGLTVDCDTLDQIKALGKRGAVIIHYNPDDPFGGFGIAGWRTFLKAIPQYDVHIVPRRVNVAEYQECGATRVLQALPAWGYAEDVHRPVAVDERHSNRFRADLGFVGSFENERGRILMQLAHSKFDVRVIGFWPKKYLTDQMKHTPMAVLNEEYVAALRSFKIALGFLRKNNRDLHTSRSIEIPACGVFMLAERSEEHLELFEEGKEAEYFDNIEELTDKADFYLKNQQARQRIAVAGRLRCERSRYGNIHRMDHMLKSALRYVGI